jgi:hypothetical protein
MGRVFTSQDRGLAGRPARNLKCETALKKEGKSRDEVVAAKPTANYDAKWGGFVINGDFFTRLVYAGVELYASLAGSRRN